MLVMKNSAQIPNPPIIPQLFVASFSFTPFSNFLSPFVVGFFSLRSESIS